MPPLGPTKRRDLIRNLKKLGFQGPFSGGKHQYMVKGQVKLIVPNPHPGDISRDFMIKLLQQAEIDRNEWEQL
ncbi:MAG: type II toxin-antitoxin system HicA family toxin [Deinococcota bacterium]|nr:type II toxin-antitoxin system HicA family toxin [Deinococcota bacterium]